jgi:hypothetical protein
MVSKKGAVAVAIAMLLGSVTASAQVQAVDSLQAYRAEFAQKTTTASCEKRYRSMLGRQSSPSRRRSQWLACRARQRTAKQALLAVRGTGPNRVAAGTRAPR